SATVEVAFATTGGTPTYINAGSVRNEPPPATAFKAPASKAVKKSRTTVDAGTPRDDTNPRGIGPPLHLLSLTNM
ncbi:MAG: hypothetical protein AB7P22_15705, partial [Vicinamibacterales bacterium]